MKKCSFFVLLVLFLNLFIMKVDAAKNPYKETSRFGTNCTWYAWKNAYEKGGVALPGWGNAKNWANDAKKSGFEVGDTPRTNSIMVEPNLTDWGHVIYVEKVKDGKMYVWDTGEPCRDFTNKKYQECIAATYDPITDMYDGNAYYDCHVIAPETACERDTAQGGSLKYIYLDSVSKTTKASTTNKVTTKKETTTTTTTKAKSSNAYLSNLTIKDLEINFDKETFEYTLNVDNNITSISVDAIPEDETAIVQGFGEIELEVGENIVEIFVTAEDETSKTYTLKVYREDKETATTKKVEVNNNKNKFNNKTYFIIGGIIGVTILTIAIIKLRKK